MQPWWSSFRTGDPWPHWPFDQTVSRYLLLPLMLDMWLFGILKVGFCLLQTLLAENVLYEKVHFCASTEKKLVNETRNAHSKSVTGLKFLPDEPLLVSSSPDNTLKVGDMNFLCPTEGNIFLPLARANFCIVLRGFKLLPSPKLEAFCNYNVWLTAKGTLSAEIKRNSLTPIASYYGCQWIVNMQPSLFWSLCQSLYLTTIFASYLSIPVQGATHLGWVSLFFPPLLSPFALKTIPL